MGSENIGYLNFNVLDLIFIVTIIISLIIGIFRGLVREILSLGSWVMAFVMTYLYGSLIAIYINDIFRNVTLSYFLAYIGVFLATLIFMSLISKGIGKIFSLSGLKGIDRVFGGLFGISRAFLIISGVLIFAPMTKIAEKPWYQESIVIPYIEPVSYLLLNKFNESFTGLSILNIE